MSGTCPTTDDRTLAAPGCPYHTRHKNLCLDSRTGGVTHPLPHSPVAKEDDILLTGSLGVLLAIEMGPLVVDQPERCFGSHVGLKTCLQNQRHASQQGPVARDDLAKPGSGQRCGTTARKAQNTAVSARAAPNRTRQAAQVIDFSSPRLSLRLSYFLCAPAVHHL